MPTYDPNNIFAKILRGEIPCQQVYADEWALAFHDIHPKAPTHVLVIPRGSYVDLHDFARHAKPEEIAGFYRAVAQVVDQLNLIQGYRTIANSGVHSGQEVPHFHLHILGGRPLGPMLMSA